MRYFRATSLMSVLVTITLLSGCSWISRNTPSWIGGNETSSEESREDAMKAKDPARLQIIHETDTPEANPEVMKGITLSTPAAIEEWTQEGGGADQVRGHLKGSLLKEVVNHADVGNGYDWNPLAIAPSPIITKERVFAMDGRGVISAHDRRDISTVFWKSREVYSNSGLLAGGLAYSKGTLYAVNGHGTLVALDAKTGAARWRRDLAEPVRSSLRVHDDTVLVSTAESHLLAYETEKGTLLWQHRGVGESTNLFGGASPVLAGDDGVLVAYPSGELFRLRLASGEVVWGDTLVRPRRTLAAGLFAGVDANPVSDGKMVVAAASSDLILADDVNTGLRLWELPVGTTHSPWLDTSLLFLITEEGNITAITADRGEIGWSKPLSAEKKKVSATHYYGPFLLNETLVAFDNAGTLYQFSPLTGDVIRRTPLVDTLISSPVFAGKSAYLLSRDATLYQVD